MTNILLCLLFLFSPFISAGQHSIVGYVLDLETRDTLPFVNVYVQLESGEICGTTSTIDGRFVLKFPFPADSLLVFSDIGYEKKTIQINGIQPNHVLWLGDIFLEPKHNQTYIPWLHPYNEPLFSNDSQTPYTIQITETNSTRSQQGLFSTIAIQIPGISSPLNNSAIHFKGSRSDANLILLDGMKVRGELNIPLSAISTAQVYGNGTPACYGDATGTIISIQTKDYAKIAKDHEVHYYFRDDIVVY